jgi:glutaminyl-peptide cyclotransferase
LSLPLRARPLAIVLAVQLVLGGVLLFLIASGTLSDWLTGGDDASTTTSQPQRPRAAAPAVPAVPAAKVDRVDGARAMAWARRQVALGPRPAGSPAQRRAAAFLRAALPDGRFVPIGGGLRNIEGRLPGRGSPILVIAHYDTTPVPGYLGANNSAAAVGVVLEIARALRREKGGGRPVRFLLTDGEEAPDYPVSGDFYPQGLRGSRAAAAKPPRPSAVIVLDFVGQKGLRILHESGSDPALWARLRAAAAKVGVGAVFPPEEQNEVLDDHTPYARRGIPAIDLIDFDYPCWQRTCDTLDKLSVRSMDAAGEAVLELVRELRRS